MPLAYLGLGSNLGDREDALQRAVTALQSEDLRIRRLSSVYETNPRDLLEQPLFLNMVLEAETSLAPLRLLLRVLNVEKRLGRKRVTPKGPRLIDIDVLLYGNSEVATPQITVPHPRMQERRFVLEPLAELAPELQHPVLGMSIRDLLARTSDQQVQRIDWTPVIPAYR